MRIVQLANLVHPSSGGLRAVVERLGAGYVAAGHERIVIAPGGRHARRLASDGSVRVTVPGVRVPGAGGYRLIVERTYLRDLLRTLRPDAIEVSDRFTLPWVAAWARRRGVPATVVVHERLQHVVDTWVPAGRASQPLVRRADRSLARAAGSVVVPSRFAASAFPVGAAQVIPWGVDRDTFMPLRSMREVARTPGRGLRLVSVGRLSREKRPDLALATVRALLERRAEVRLDVVGTGPLLGPLRRAARGLPVSFHGHLPAREVASHLAQADVTLATCPAEAFGLAALESLACGTPIVAPTTGALPELLDVPAGTPAVTPAGATATPSGRALAFAVEQLLGYDRAERHQAALAAAEARPWTSAVTAMLARHGDPGRLRVAA